MTEQQRVARIADDVLNMIDACPNGAPLFKVWELMGQAITFRVFVLIVNRLSHLDLIWIDPNHIAHRVRS